MADPNTPTPAQPDPDCEYCGGDGEMVCWPAHEPELYPCYCVGGIGVEYAPDEAGHG